MECLKQLIVSFIMFLSIYAMNVYAKELTIVPVIAVSIFVFFVAGKIFGIFKFLEDIKTLKED